MGYSMNDLNNATKNIEDSINDRNRRKGEELAGKILHGNLIGFMLARVFNYLTIYLVITLCLTLLFDMQDGISMLISMVVSIFILKQDFFWFMYFKYALLLFIAMFVIASFLDKIF